MIVLSIQLVPISASAASNDVAGIENGRIYYIKNLYTGHYLDVQGGGDDYNGQNVMGYNYHGLDNQKWKAVRNSDGTYTFVSVFSTSGRVLDVTGTNVDIYAANFPSAQKFTLVRDTTLAYGGTYYIKHGSNYVTETIQDDNVCTKTSAQGLASRWSFQAVDKNHVGCYFFEYTDSSGTTNTTGAGSTIKTNMNGIGYTTYNLKNYGASTAHYYMQTDNVWVFFGHGLYTVSGNPMASVVFKDANGDYAGYLTASTAIFNGSSDRAISSFSSNALAPERCVLYIGCGTGVTYNGYNLVTSTFNKGAHFALGTKEKVSTGDGEKWLKNFFNKAGSGGTIRQCIDNANYYQNIGLLYYEGDVYAKFS